jgi:hypothetical protein
VDPENDKNAVIALREIAEKTIDPRDVREGLIHSMLHNAEVDEPESTAEPTWPHTQPPVLLRDDPSTDMDAPGALQAYEESLAIRRGLAAASVSSARRSAKLISPSVYPKRVGRRPSNPDHDTHNSPDLA